MDNKPITEYTNEELWRALAENQEMAYMHSNNVGIIKTEISRRENKSKEEIKKTQ